jgi:hypothetical protein
MRLSCLFVPSVLAALAVAGCTTETKIVGPGGTPPEETPPLTVSDEYRRLGDNLGQAIAQLKSSATTEGSVVPAELGGVAAIAKAKTGGVDLSAAQNGKRGERKIDIDVVGEKEDVAIFVPSAPTGGGTSATLPSFVGWKGDADSGDEGLCYVGWTKGSSWVVASPCDDTSGAWVCEISSDAVTCNACNTAGKCTPCDVAENELSCTW